LVEVGTGKSDVSGQSCELAGRLLTLLRLSVAVAVADPIPLAPHRVGTRMFGELTAHPRERVLLCIRIRIVALTVVAGTIAITVLVAVLFAAFSFTARVDIGSLWAGVWVRGKKRDGFGLYEPLGEPTRTGAKGFSSAPSTLPMDAVV
jgi:hypothetical protein